MKTRNIVMIVAIGLIFIGAIVVFVLAYVQDHARERTLLQVCWMPSGEAQYVDDGYSAPIPEEDRACNSPESLVWSHDALSYTIVSHDGTPLDGRGPESSVVEAVELVNAQLDTRLTRVMDTEAADIVVTFREAYEVSGGPGGPTGDAGGYCVHERVDGRLRAHAAVRARGSTRCEYLTAIHELGHCLGLGHSSWGVMSGEDLCSEDRLGRFGDAQSELIVQTYR